MTGDDDVMDRREAFLALSDEKKWQAHVAELQAKEHYRVAGDRLRPRGEGLLTGLPIWVRVITLVGFPVVCAAFLLAQTAGWVPSLAQGQTASLKSLESVMTQHVRETNVLIGRLSTALRVMCENSARDEVGRNNCRAIEERGQ